MFLGQFLHLLLERGHLSLQLLDSGLLARKPALNDEHGRDQLGLVFLLSHHQIRLGLGLLTLLLND